jgi:upstream activation factor subunit UAF30
MFKELFTLTERAPVILLVSREGENLRVNLTRKQDENEKEVPLALSIVGSPAELDQELPIALAEGYSLHEAEKKPASVADQVKAQVSEAEAEAPATKRERKAVTPKVAKKKSPKPRAAKPAKVKAPAKVATPKAPRTKASATTKRAGKVTVPSPELARVIGTTEPLKHNAAMVKVWDYVKAHDLKGKPAAGGGAYINADANLRSLFGGKDKLPSTRLAKLVKQHLVPAETITAPIAPLIKPMGPKTMDPTPAITPLLKPDDLARANAPEPAADKSASTIERVVDEPPAAAAAPAVARNAADVDLFS